MRSIEHEINSSHTPVVNVNTAVKMFNQAVLCGYCTHAVPHHGHGPRRGVKEGRLKATKLDLWQWTSSELTLRYTVHELLYI